MNTCLLCGATTHDVRMGLVEWVEPVGRERYSAIPRCTNWRACRSRLEELGDEWPTWNPIDSRGHYLEAR